MIRSICWRAKYIQFVFKYNFVCVHKCANIFIRLIRQSDRTCERGMEHDMEGGMEGEIGHIQVHAPHVIGFLLNDGKRFAVGHVFCICSASCHPYDTNDA